MRSSSEFCAGAAWLVSQVALLSIAANPATSDTLLLRVQPWRSVWGAAAEGVVAPDMWGCGVTQHVASPAVMSTCPVADGVTAFTPARMSLHEMLNRDIAQT